MSRNQYLYQKSNASGSKSLRIKMSLSPMVLASNAIWHISLKMHFACMHGTDFGQKCNAFLKIIALTMHFWGKINLNFDFYHALFWFCQKFSYHACILHAKFPLPCILHVCNYALHVCNAFNARTMDTIRRLSNNCILWNLCSPCFSVKTPTNIDFFINTLKPVILT